jgi:tRNA A58 N-methylase Trm61
MNVWAVSEDEKWDMLECVVKPEDLESTVAVIVLDFDRPWDLMASLKRWLTAL